MNLTQNQMKFVYPVSQYHAVLNKTEIPYRIAEHTAM